MTIINTRNAIAAAATVLVISLAFATMFLSPGEAGANTRPECNNHREACVLEWVHYWFEEPTIRFQSDEMLVTRRYNLPSASTKYVTRGSNYVKLMSVRAEHRIASDDGTDRTWHSVEDHRNTEDGVLERGSQRIQATYTDPGTRGLVMTRYQVEIEYGRGSTVRTANYTVWESPTAVRYEDTRCLLGRPSDGYIKISYMRSERTGRLSTKYVLPDNNNPKRCAGHEWATEGVAYQYQVCKGRLCTRPDLIGGGYTFQGDSKFAAGIRKLSGDPRTTEREYSVISRDEDVTSQMTFEGWIWQYIGGDYDDMEEYVLFQACEGFDCDGPRVIKGRQISNHVRD